MRLAVVLETGWVVHQGRHLGPFGGIMPSLPRCGVDRGTCRNVFCTIIVRPVLVTYLECWDDRQAVFSSLSFLCRSCSGTGGGCCLHMERIKTHIYQVTYFGLQW